MREEDVKVLRLAITERCPLKCPSCYAQKLGRTLGKDIIKEVIKEAFDDGYEYVAIGGGEPLCAMPEVREAIRVAKHFGMCVAVTTSGFGLREEALKELEGLDLIQLSLGAYRENIIESYELLRDSGRRFGINLLISPKSTMYLTSALKRFEEDGVAQTTILLPKPPAPLFSLDALVDYLATLGAIERTVKSMRVYVDCLTNRLLMGKCYSQGCSFFADLTVSRCAFGAPRARWRGSLARAVDEANDAFSDCPLLIHLPKSPRRS